MHRPVGPKLALVADQSRSLRLSLPFFLFESFLLDSVFFELLLLAFASSAAMIPDTFCALFLAAFFACTTGLARRANPDTTSTAL